MEQRLLTIPRIILAGTHSGCGKTTVARGLMAAFRKRGLEVQPFKIGPDFIDPGYHSAICGRTSRNLDPFMMGEEGVIDTFVRTAAGADIAVIEGVMGMFDGLDGTGISSTAHVARVLGAPVILVADVRGMSRSVHALVRGFAGFDPEVSLSGVIFNRVGSDRHRSLVEHDHSFPALGFIPRDPGLTVESRHLGLKMAFETGIDPSLAGVIGDSCDLDRILEIASAAPTLPAFAPKETEGREKAVIGVAFDSAFCFYYQDNLDRLRTSGATLTFFSPLAEGLVAADGYYLGGGYPELHAGGLETSACRFPLKDAADRGLPIFAECGGMMFLTESITTGGEEYAMAGILPAAAVMTGKIQAMRSSLGHWGSGVRMAGTGLEIRGHEFHYSYLEPSGDARFAIDLSRGKGIAGGKDGLFSHEAVGTYTHSYFSDEFARSFVNAAARFRERS
jgi:cobyrinic acid a,c-diamide synthase